MGEGRGDRVPREDVCVQLHTCTFKGGQGGRVWMSWLFFLPQHHVWTGESGGAIVPAC